ncbi:diguanylate cyclase [Deinococcus sp. HMF7620]|uniref:Diguanylate cyclase n=1 Tax=Deinococcus arboris TaxID=2682977 RepID=A0A7C9I3V5_9DEIO|nr:histidine kinase N-terminal 7TM domain-containing protein [Deinococcus arboris]MVN87731.1 diguanylate cyclase [Deinococcus arboris]
MLEYTPYVVPFLVSLGLTSALALVAVGRPSPAARTFVWLMLGLSIWTLCYALELCSPTLAGKHAWLVAKYVGAAPTPLLWLVFCLYATGREAWLTRRVQWTLAGWAALTFAVVCTDSVHHLMWTELRVVPGEPELQAGHGPFFWLYAAAIYASILTSVVLFTRFYWTAQPLFRRQGLLLTLGGFAPLAGRMSEDLFGLDLLPRVDEVIFFFLVSAVLFALALFRYSALRLVPIAHHLVVHNIRAGIVVLDLSGRVVDLNPFARELFGLTGNAGVGAPSHTVLPYLAPPDAPQTTDEEVTLLSRGQPAYFTVQRSPIRGASGRLSGQAVVLFDVTARREAEQQLRQLAQSDALTGVHNRRHFVTLAGQALAQAGRSGQPFAVVMMDIDRFKGINDTYGHPAGDEVLRAVAQTCQARLRRTDLFARYGGEEFVALLPATSAPEAQQVAEALREAVEALRLEDAGRPIPVTLSLGLVAGQTAQTTQDQTPQDLDLHAWIAQADAALYAAKTGGRNRVTLAVSQGRGVGMAVG